MLPVLQVPPEVQAVRVEQGELVPQVLPEQELREQPVQLGLVDLRVLPAVRVEPAEPEGLDPRVLLVLAQLGLQDRLALLAERGVQVAREVQEV